MKYKIIGIVLCAAVVFGAIVLQRIPDNKAHRYHQHVEAIQYQKCDMHTDEEEKLCTHLPIVEINTNGMEIPGKAIIENDKLVGFTTTLDGKDEIQGKITVVDNKDKNNHLSDTSAVESEIMIHIRGNSSRTFDKSGYAVRLITDDGINNPQEIMGMDSHHEWVLHGPFIDKSLIRNYMWYNVSGEIMGYAPNVRFCEVLINGEYNGLYVMTESITAGKDGARLPLSVNKKRNSYGGYILRLDRGSTSEIKNIDTFTKYSYRTQNQINIVYPGSVNLNENIRQKIIDDFSAFEKSLYSYDYNSNEYGYKAMIDTRSFVDYLIINEFTCNYDAGWLSTYVYKDIDGKLKTCIWDMNSACNNYKDYIVPDHFEFQNCLWFFMLCKDKDFTNDIVSRYRYLRTTYLNEDYLTSYVDSVVEYLGPAIDRNWEKWGYTFEKDEYTDRNPEHQVKDYPSAVEQIKHFIKVRGEWLDENIETIKQYSAESKVKKFNEVAN